MLYYYCLRRTGVSCVKYGVSCVFHGCFMRVLQCFTSFCASDAVVCMMFLERPYDDDDDDDDDDIEEELQVDDTPRKIR